MRIGIDASRAVSPQRTGTENYSLHLIRRLLDMQGPGAGRQEFTLYCNRAPGPGLFPPGDHHRVQVMPFPRLWTHLRLSWEMAFHAPDVLFVPAHVIPLVHPRASVVTIHDLGHLYFPEAYPKKALRYLAWSTGHNVRAAAHLLADSEATKRDLCSHFSISPEGVTVVYPGVGPEYRPNQDPAMIEAVKKRYQITYPYVLHVGTLQPRKNIERLLEAFALARSRRGLQERLVLVGRTGWLSESLQNRIRDMADAVVLVGYIPESDLPFFYAGATVFVLPSLFEGFGMPLLEAMASGTPVIAANTSSLPEVVGDAGLLFDPLSTEALAEALARACENRQLRERLQAGGLARSKQFTWEEAARKTLDVLKKVGES